MKHPWMDSTLAIDRRVALLLGELTVEEKIGQLTQTPELYEKDAPVVRAGRVGSCILANSEFAGQEVEKVVSVASLNALQQVAVEESRMGVPILYARDIIHGLRTVFPVPLGQAATWSPADVEKSATVAAREARAVGVAWTFAPILDVARDPRWGRVVEGFGEDPFLTSTMGAAAVRGFQGEDPSASDRLMACGKHFAGYGAVEGGREYNTADVSERTLGDVYLPPFRAAVNAGVGSIMAAYNDVAGIPSACHHGLLTGTLRESWGFDGPVISDWAIVERLLVHGVAADEDEAVVKSLEAGCDMDMCSQIYERRIAGLVASGRLDEDLVSRSVARVLRAKFLLGLFENPYTDEAIAATVVMCDEHVAAAREVARRSLVLLRNENDLLPLAKDVARLAVLGPLAEARAELNGSWCADAVAADVVTVADGVRAALSPETEVVTSGPTADEMLEAARGAEAVVMVVGEHPSRSGEGGGVANLTLPSGQEDMIRAVMETGVPTILVVIAGRPLALGWIAEHVPAILYAWQPGMQGGHAIADVLFGDENPGARLPITFPRAAGQIPAHYNRKQSGVVQDGDPRRHSPYKDLRRDPLYPFGFGLSYTTFEYADLGIEVADGGVRLSAGVTNSGNRDGEEVVQLYVRDVVASVTRPVKELKGFERVALAVGETKRVAFRLTADDLAYTRSDMTWGSDPGEYTVWIGPNSQEGLEGSFTLE